MSTNRPIVVALPLDAQTDDILNAAGELAARIAAPIVPVHALAWKPLESDAALATRTADESVEVEAHIAPLREIGTEILPAVIEREVPDELVMRVAHEVGAQLIVTGGGGPMTVRRWVIGSVAEKIVRHAHVPVWVARGALPIRGQILCPVDLSPQSRVGLTAATRMARLFDAKLVVLSVLPEEDHGWLGEEELMHRLDSDEERARVQVEEFLAATDTSGVDLEVRITIGKPSTRIVEASQDASLIVIGSREFDMLKPGALGTVTERALRFSRCSAMTIRDTDAGRERRERSLMRIAELTRKANALLAAGDPQRALPLLQMAASRAPANAAVQEALAAALEGVGREEEAEGRRKLARMIRDSFQ
ncbi:MAG: universal stress protein [Myxococcales bacterium]|nr:universal stress protein [Myxococcales bacterium]